MTDQPTPAQDDSDTLTTLEQAVEQLPFDEKKLMTAVAKSGPLYIYVTDVKHTNTVIALETKGLVSVDRSYTNGNYMIVSLTEKTPSAPDDTSSADAEQLRDYLFGPQNGTPLIPLDTTECRYCSAPHGKAHLPGCERYEPWQDALQRENERLTEQLEALLNEKPRTVYPTLQVAGKELEKSFMLAGVMSKTQVDGSSLIINAAMDVLNALYEAHIITRPQS